MSEGMIIPAAGNPVGKGKYPDSAFGEYDKRKYGLDTEVRNGGININWANEGLQKLIEGVGGVLSIEEPLKTLGEVVMFRGKSRGVEFSIMPIHGTPDVGECETIGAGPNIFTRRSHFGESGSFGYLQAIDDVVSSIPSGVPTSIDFARSHLVKPDVGYAGGSDLKSIVSDCVGEEGSESLAGNLRHGTFWEALVCGYYIDKLPLFWLDLFDRGSDGFAIVFPERVMLKMSGSIRGFYYPGLKMLWSNGARKRILCPVFIPISREYHPAGIRIVVVKNKV